MLTIATFNLCNLGVDASPARLARLARIIVHEMALPEILAVQEITAEAPILHNGQVPATATYQALIAAIMDAGGAQYTFREIPPLVNQDGGMAGANIRVGLLFNPAHVKFPDRGNAGSQDNIDIAVNNGRINLTLNPGRIYPIHPAFAGDPCHHWTPCRKMLAAEFEVGTQQLFVINCHFKSMRSMARREEDYTKKQRHAQAELVHHFASMLLRHNPETAIVLLGDINDVASSKTLKLLKGELFHNLLDDLPRSQSYTRRHSGQPQALDHILVSPVLRRGATVRIPHVNSDITPGNPAPVSDHDPVVATLPALAVCQ
ncbi:MAG: hypothetical protein CSA09_03890 [Candidatus Contendobacter odensis]|uniref:Endonuclease/exonuclease/phosphatase domain-containing protein n=1 Tax=Candidatus Contendibacter odensensis TaxID=1400860 RepID=A0A2G6PET0_9GAMM|nr:MAG: hypothetical protein CSA09_03890 [Candidatus Contendobacter odensis]